MFYFSSKKALMSSEYSMKLSLKPYLDRVHKVLYKFTDTIILIRNAWNNMYSETHKKKKKKLYIVMFKPPTD